ncbi:MAG: 50S ribosomal protein L11 methyltransferase [Ignavibacteria bacterium]|nr:50S ribosomal protein L11 methyltransferase [Ignavibacteria bacterium]
MLNKFVYVVLETKEELFDLISAVLSEYPILGIEEKFDQMLVCFNSSDWEKINHEKFFEKLKTIDPFILLKSVEVINEKNWNEEWEKSLTPIVVTERIAICPSWRRGETNAPIEILIDPKMSFGTGHHSTTQLMIKLAEKYILPDTFWIDVGTGTGILAILAKKLGAKEVLAMDNNSWAIQNIYENLIINSIDTGVDVVELDLDLIPNLPESDGIFANLNIDLIVRNFSKFYDSLQRKNGILLASGLLIYDEDEFLKKAEFVGFSPVEILYSNEWMGIAFKIGE